MRLQHGIDYPQPSTSRLCTTVGPQEEVAEQLTLWISMSLMEIIHALILAHAIDIHPNHAMILRFCDAIKGILFTGPHSHKKLLGLPLRIEFEKARQLGLEKFLLNLMVALL